MNLSAAKLIPVISAVLLFVSISCEKQQPDRIPSSERELTIPEKVEKEVLDVLSNDWKSLSDTIRYFDSTMLSKGIYNGIGPDGVHYELIVNAKLFSDIETVFKIEDTVRLSLSGKLLPAEVTLNAFETELSVKSRNDSTCIAIADVSAVFPWGFLILSEKNASLLYKGENVGYITLEEYENTDYSTGKFLTIHYFNDPRTFTLYDNGLGELLQRNLNVLQ